jgi:hypothetical protein
MKGDKEAEHNITGAAFIEAAKLVLLTTLDTD